MWWIWLGLLSRFQFSHTHQRSPISHAHSTAFPIRGSSTHPRCVLVQIRRDVLGSKRPKAGFDPDAPVDHVYENLKQVQLIQLKHLMRSSDGLDASDVLSAALREFCLLFVWWCLIHFLGQVYKATFKPVEVCFGTLHTVLSVPCLTSGRV